MKFSGFKSKNDPKQNAGQATVTVPSTQDANKGPAQTDQKGNPKPNLQAPGISDTGDQAKSDGKDSRQDAKNGSQPTLNAAASGDKTDSEAMVSEGGHTAANDAHRAVREPDATTHAKTDSAKGSVDGASDDAAPKLSAKPSI